MCPISVTDTSTHLIRKFADKALQDYLLPKMLTGDVATHVEGHAIHDRARRRVRCRRDRDGGALRGRRVAAHRRQMVLLACRCRCRAAAGAPGGGTVRDKRPCAVRTAAPAEGRQPQRLPDRASEGQARHPLDGFRGNPAGGRGRVSRRRREEWPQADDGAGQPVAAVAWRAGFRDDAALPERGDGLRQQPGRLRQDHHRISAAAPPADEDHAAGRSSRCRCSCLRLTQWTAPMPATRTLQTSCAS